jgi:hypothetical protein
MVPPMRWGPGAAIKTEVDIQTDYLRDGPIIYVLNDRNALNGLTVFTIMSIRPRKPSPPRGRAGMVAPMSG